MSMLNEEWTGKMIEEYREDNPDKWEDLKKLYTDDTEFKYTALLLAARKQKNQMLALQVKQEAAKAGIILH